jgi:glycosyltransferase involved in cell wall biosynthesis
MILWSDNQASPLSVGYGYVPDRLFDQLSKTDLPITRNNSAAPEEIQTLLDGFSFGYLTTKESHDEIVINHSMPESFIKSSIYSIGLTFWETNRLPDSWVFNCNRMDEVWTASRFMRDVFINSGVSVPVHAFNLGVDPEIFFPVKRTQNRPFTFLSIGSPSTRKNSQMSVDAFIKVFGGQEGYRMIYKSNGPADARSFINGMRGKLNHPQIEVIDWEVSVEELGRIYDCADCLLYPTSGEGWGLIPFQAIAKGIPTICTNATACEEYAHMSVPLDYEWSTDKMSGIYDGAGYWAKPNFDDLCDKMLYVVNDYDKVATKTFQSAEYINKNMTWELVSKDYVNRLCQILKDTKAKLS